MCRVCNRKVRTNQKGLSCIICKGWLHSSCVGLANCAFSEPWFCTVCISSAFPFNHIDDDTEFQNAICSARTDLSRIQCATHLHFKPFSTNENRFLLNDENVDPDNNFFNEIQFPESKYFIASDLAVTDHQNDSYSTRTNLSLLHLNVRSLNANYQGLLSLIDEMKCNIPVIAVTETWTSINTENDFPVTDYSFVAKSRTHKSGGGVGLYISNDISCQRRDDIQIDVPDVFESIFVELVPDNILIGCIYRPPNSNVASFTALFDTLLAKINSLKLSCYIAGDFNINLLNYHTHSPTASFVNCAFSHSYFPLIDKPTRITPTSATLIDNIFTNTIDQNNFSSSIICDDVSDHLPIFVRINSTNSKIRKSKVIYKRLFSAAEQAKFMEALCDIDWDSCLKLNSTNIESSYTAFSETFQTLFNDSFPLRRITSSNKKTPRKPWMTKALANSCNKKAKLYKTFILKPTESNKYKYSTYRNKLNKLLGKAQQSYYFSKFEACKQDIKKTWQSIKYILNKNILAPPSDSFKINGKLSTDRLVIANKFNEYFTNIGPTLAAKIPQTSKDYNSFLKYSQKNSFCYVETFPEEIISIVKQMLPKTSSGFDNIPVSIMKLSIQNIAYPLSKLINKSVLDGSVPNQLKIARVCPAYKGGDKSEFTNYRPISILPSFSKVFEKVMYNRLITYLDRYSLLYDKQFGFRSKHSTFMAVLEMVDKISAAIDNNEYSIGIFVDLSKAFDTLNHAILLRKLEHYGIRGTLLNWFRSYLSNRSQYVEFDGQKSTYQDIVCGVPQGSILGPLLFLLYVNDIAQVSSIFHLILFADDTNIFMRHKHFDQLIQIANTELDKLNAWFLANKLSINVSKTNFVIFANRKKKYDPLTAKISIDKNCLNQVSSAKFLGIIIDERLSWNEHISQLESKISKSTGIMIKLKNILPQRVLLTIYNSLVLPYLNYCTLIWANNSENKLLKIYRIQKRAVRTIGHAHYTEHAAPLFKKFNLLNIKDIGIQQTCQFMYKFSHKQLPGIFDSYFSENQSIHCYNTRQSNKLHIQRARTNVRNKSIRFQGPHIWNTLPPDITSAPSLYAFNSRLKSHLIALYE